MAGFGLFDLDAAAPPAPLAPTAAVVDVPHDVPPVPVDDDDVPPVPVAAWPSWSRRLVVDDAVVFF